MGTASVTTSGKKCQAWTATTPHVPYHTVTDDKFPDGSRAAAKNYCRTLGANSRGPWCYTMDPNTRWEECNIPRCTGRYIFQEYTSALYKWSRCINFHFTHTDNPAVGKEES